MDEKNWMRKMKWNSKIEKRRKKSNQKAAFLQGCLICAEKYDLKLSVKIREIYGKTGIFEETIFISLEQFSSEKTMF